MYSSNNVQFQVYCQSFHTARSLKVTELISVFCMYKVLIGLFTTKPCNKLSGNTNIGFKRENNKTIDLTALEKFDYFFSCHYLPTVCLGGYIWCYYPSLGRGLSCLENRCLNSLACDVCHTLGGLLRLNGFFRASPFLCVCLFNLRTFFRLQPHCIAAINC